MSSPVRDRGRDCDRDRDREIQDRIENLSALAALGLISGQYFLALTMPGPRWRLGK